MKRKVNIPQKKHHSDLIQIGTMKSNFPDFRHFYNRDGKLTFVGRLQPKETMPVYTVSIEFRGDSMPRVRVITPSLVDNPPHYYSEGYLCLYKPSDFKWAATRPISNYIVTWTSCWIYFYEVWKEKGEWIGPEAEHGPNEKKNEI